MKAALFVIILIHGLVGYCFAESNFSDIPDDHWAKESVEVLYEKGILSGYENGDFEGDRPVTRYEMAVALHSLLVHIEDTWPAKYESQIPGNPNTHLHSKKAMKKMAFRGDFTVGRKEMGRSMAQMVKNIVETRFPEGGVESRLLQELKSSSN